MKKSILIIVITLMCFSNQAFSQKKLLNTLKDIFNVIAEQSYQVVDITNQTVKINSTTNIGGKSKEVIKINLPDGTERVSFRVTLIPVKSNYQYEKEESFYSLIMQRNAKEVYAPQNKGINFFIFNRSFDVDAFTTNKNGNAIFHLENTNSFIQSIGISPGSYWIGLQNKDAINGLKAIVEVVAFGHFN